MIPLARLRSARRRFGASAYRWVGSLGTGEKRLILLAVDLLAINVSLGLAVSLSLNRPLGGSDLSGLWAQFTLLTAAGGVLLWVLGLPKIKLKTYDWKAILRTAAFATLMIVAGLAVDRATGNRVPGSVYVSAGILMFSVMVLGRVLQLQLLLWIYRQQFTQRRVLIYGAGSTGMQLAAALATHDSIEAVAFIDDNRALRGLTIAGLPVHGPADLPRLIESKRIDRVLMAMPQLPPQKLSVKLLRLQALGVDVHSVPSFAQLAGEEELLAGIRAISMSDLLGRSQVHDELPGARDTFAGRSVMVTGAGGSIGSELCRQLVACGPARIVLYEMSEPALYQIHRELQGPAAERGVAVVPRLGSVTDGRVLRRVVQEERVQAILHAAAYKHVPLVEDNQLAGLANNVLGTRIAAEAARDAGVEHFLLVSSDKAVRPKNVMGASKRLAELVVQDLATRATATRFSIVRFGNVLGSSGSVIPLFQDQIARGGPVTLTHDEVTRYFMTIPEAARLVLTAVTYARGGDVFVLDMGDPVPIRRMAEQMIENAGLTVQSDDNPQGDIRIVVTGLRPGEKLHEELLTGAGRVTTPHPKILRMQDERLSEIEVANMLRDLGQAIDSGDAALARRTVLRWVGENAFEDGRPGALRATQTGN